MATLVLPILSKLRSFYLPQEFQCFFISSGWLYWHNQRVPAGEVREEENPNQIFQNIAHDSFQKLIYMWHILDICLILLWPPKFKIWKHVSICKISILLCGWPRYCGCQMQNIYIFQVLSIENVLKQHFIHYVFEAQSYIWIDS